ncbi:hypothetical protein PYW07_007453 [Mythimna separata]|uniref:GB1/RHD3-type G domain-containing protein n=1 Tax=Mythimna separata TaxID=271217 RepID=A0AAD7Z1X7_MYTSE|nr:hypothetical protein PYW07_007453 [Mythimna separata]
MSGASESAASAGVPVVRLGGGGGARYELDEEALRRVLLRPGVQELPAVVVSVAGAYRGGKSFILDFFLRYLTAPRSCQLSGEWLGKEDEQLKGFHWRGGGERDTTGIHLWPEPIVTTRSNGEKVAVLLMDTQGTFDSESTIGQNSTIFALSTLISSVQIYNLSGNIKEDDLQHLQLFTEYGKLACEGDDKAFQTLLFLVRDWASAYEHAHGYSGGASLLNKRLQSKPNQNTELREVREHISSCFDSIKCFLMPHPGLAVENQSFTGCLRELTEKFRLALLELVPSLFDSERLTPKLINGERVRVQDLFDYFRKYVDIYNSDEAPEATTIYKATADACLLAASRAASSVYAACMEPRINGPRSLSRRVLADEHAIARASAEKVYAQKKKLGSKTDVQDRLQELIKELHASLSLYVLSNDAKVRETMSLARKAYDTAVSNVCGDHAQLCLHPDDLKELHDEAYKEALTVFDSAREVYKDEEDEQRTALVKSLEQQYGHLRAINEQNNRSAVLGARDQYVTRMKLQMDHTGVSSHKLEAQNQVAKEDAIEFFAKKRNRNSTDHFDDPYLENLMEEISGNFAEYEKANINNNRLNMQVAEFTYNNYIMSEWGSQMCCFHPRALDSLHKRAVDVALEAFMVNRERSEDDDFKMEVIKNLEQRRLDLMLVNKFNNEESVEKAFILYSMKMDKHTRPSVLSVLVVPFFVKLLALLPGHHENARMLAISDFRSRRRGTDDYGDDTYLDDLKERMDIAYANYRNPALCILRELGVNID